MDSAPSPPDPELNHDQPLRPRGAARLLQLFPVEFPPDSYFNSGPIAVGARLIFLIACVAVIVAALGPHSFKPRNIGHYHLARFAAWYVLSTMAAAALPRARLRWLGLGAIVFAISAEVVRALPFSLSESLRENIYADIGGVYAAIFPMIIARWRWAVMPRTAVSKVL